MNEKPNYKPIESVLDNIWGRMCHAKNCNDSVAYEQYKSELLAVLTALGNACPDIRRKYETLLTNGDYQ